MKSRWMGGAKLSKVTKEAEEGDLIEKGKTDIDSKQS